MEDLTNPYEVLELPYGASLRQVKAAWRAAARKYHPDANPEDPEHAAEKFAQAKEAYETLTASLENLQTPEPEEEPEDIPDHPQPIHDPFAAHPGPVKPGANVKVTLPMTLAQAVEGDTTHVQLTYQIPCPLCAGTGADGCECADTGSKLIKAWQEVTIPAETASGTVLRMPRRGGPGWGGAPPGDLEIQLLMNKDKLWVAQGRELHARITITTASALAGATLTLPHPKGDLSVKVPPGTLTDYNVDLPGAGIRGDAHVTVSPRELDLSDPKVLAALRELDRAERASAKNK